MPCKLLGDLQDVFVPFETSRTEGGDVIFYNEYIGNGLTQGEVVSRYSYVVASPDSVEALDPCKKIFFAERYGGDGILTNGGGGRCGFDGHYQVKGIGPNELVGEGVEVSHADGFLSVQSALYETVWAEVINVALPYGAVRTLAVIDVGTDIPQRNQMQPRGLLIREPAVRPAHFIRAVYFKEKKLDSLSEDAKRVSAAIKKLVDFLPAPAVPPNKADVFSRLSSGMVELARRYAEQFAAARAKCLIHENVSASNLSLDGAWLDLSSAGIFSDLTIGDKTDVTSFEKEYFPVISCIENICYYLRKYRVISAAESSAIFNEASTAFATEYDRQFRMHSVLRAGFSKCFLMEVINDSAFLEFSKNLVMILGFEGFSTKSITLESGWKGYESWQYRLYDELLGGKVLNKEADLSWLGVGCTLIGDLKKSYSILFELICAVAVAKGARRYNVIFGMSINLTRLNRTNIVLYDFAKVIENYNESTCCDDATLSLKRLVEEVYHASYVGFFNEEDSQVPVWSSKSVSVGYDIITGMFKMKTAEQVLFSKSLSRLSGMKCDQYIYVCSFYNKVRSELFE